MKKNKMMRLASLLLVAVLLTTCTISGTYAKYVTKASGTDTARVAKFGVVVTAGSDFFNTSYDADNSISVKAADNTNVIAPGTTGTAAAFSISGAPEVDVQVTADLGIHSTVTLPAGTYKNYTTAEDDEFTLDAYTPVVWTLSRTTKDAGGNETTIDLKSGTLAEINTYLTSTQISKTCNVENNDFPALVGDYTLTWNWPFDGVNDAADTYIGQIAAGVETAPANYIGTEAFNFSITVTQLD